MLHRSTLIARGVHPRRLASDEFTAVLPGWHTPTAHPATLREICRVALAEQWPTAVISHDTAAILWGFPLPSRMRWRRGRRIHLRFVDGRRRRAAAHTVMHQGWSRGSVELEGLPVSHAFGTLWEIAPDLTDTEMLALLWRLEQGDVGPALQRMHPARWVSRDLRTLRLPPESRVRGLCETMHSMRFRYRQHGRYAGRDPLELLYGDVDLALSDPAAMGQAPEAPA